MSFNCFIFRSKLVEFKSGLVEFRFRVVGELRSWMVGFECELVGFRSWMEFRSRMVEFKSKLVGFKS